MRSLEFEQSAANSGVVANLPSTKVAWADANNMRFRPGCVMNTYGKTLLATVPNGLPIRAAFTFKGYDGSLRTIVCCDTKIYAYTEDFASYTDITPSTAPNSEGNDIWQFSLIGGMPVLTNGLNGVWKWTSYGSAMTLMPDVPVPKVMTTALHRLLMGHVYDNGYEYPSRLKWSGIIKPDNFVIDKTAKSGRADMIFPNGNNIDSIERIKGFSHSGKRTYIYSERNIWALDPYQKPYNFQLNIVAEGIGLIATRAIASVNGIDYFIAQDDLYVRSEGEGIKPIGFPIRNAVFPNLNKSALNTSFVFYLPDTKEVFYCVPTGENTAPDTAVVYNTELNNFSFCDVDYLCHTFNWTENVSAWDNIAYGSWDSIDDSRWDEMSKRGIIPYSVVGNGKGQILQLDSGTDNNGKAIESYIETGDMVLDDQRRFKTVSEIWPGLKPQEDDTQLFIKIGTRESLHHQIKWSATKALTIGVDGKIDFRDSGKYIRIRFYSNQKGDRWTLDGYTLKYLLGGYR